MCEISTLVDDVCRALVGGREKHDGWLTERYKMSTSCDCAQHMTTRERETCRRMVGSIAHPADVSYRPDHERPHGLHHSAEHFKRDDVAGGVEILRKADSTLPSRTA